MISIIIIFAIIFISIGFSAIIAFSFSFLHFLLVFESIILSICLIFAIGAFSFGKIEGDIAVLFIVAIVAAETAIAISLYVRSTISPPVRFRKKKSSATDSFKRRSFNFKKKLSFLKNI